MARNGIIIYLGLYKEVTTKWTGMGRNELKWTRKWVEILLPVWRKVRIFAAKNIL